MIENPMPTEEQILFSRKVASNQWKRIGGYCSTLSIEDFFSVALIALLLALRKFDGSKKMKLSTFIHQKVAFAISDAVYRDQEVYGKRIEDRKYYLRIGKIKKYMEEFDVPWIEATMKVCCFSLEEATYQLRRTMVTVKFEDINSN